MYTQGNAIVPLLSKNYYKEQEFQYLKSKHDTPLQLWIGAWRKTSSSFFLFLFFLVIYSWVADLGVSGRERMFSFFQSASADPERNCGGGRAPRGYELTPVDSIIVQFCSVQLLFQKTNSINYRKQLFIDSFFQTYLQCISRKDYFPSHHQSTYVLSFIL